MRVASVALVATVILGLAGACSSPSTVASVSPKPTLVADHGPPPAGVNLVYVQDPNHSGWLIGFDWTGRPRGTVKLAQPIDPLGSMTQAPDGSAFAYAPGAKGGYQLFLDRLGSPIPVPGAPAVRFEDQMWADDSRHVCTLDSGLQWNIGLIVPGAASFPRHAVAIDPSIVRSGIIAVTFVACSARNDEAVLQYSSFGRPTEFWVVRISDGKILAQRSYPAEQLVNVVASEDGALVATNSGASTGQTAPAAASTIIGRASDLSVVATLEPSVGVLGFNSDDSLALVATTPWASGVATHLALIDVHTGTAIWGYNGGEEFSTFIAQPDGRDLALLLQTPNDSSLHPSVGVVIVRANGTASQIPGRYNLL